MTFRRAVTQPRMSAVFSEDRVYRYRLERHWGHDDRPDQVLTVIGLNPSTADESTDDPTIRRCIGFARDWGCTGLVMTNLFAFRSTDPTKLTIANRTMHPIVHPAGIVGDENDHHILQAARASWKSVVAWGRWGRLLGRDHTVLSLLAAHDVITWAFKLTASGYPNHPLYLPRNTEPVLWPT